MDDSDTPQTQDKPEGTEQSPADSNPERQGPGSDPADGGHGPSEDERAGHEPPPESGPGEPGVPAPRR